jgi:membrane protein YdbS with pleckstrin-like domain
MTAKRVFIRPLSSVIYLYPTWLASIVFALWTDLAGVSPAEPGVSGILFTLMFFFNLSIVAFDYTRLSAVVIVLLMVITGLVSAMYPGVGEFIRHTLDQPMFMNATFYWVWAIGFTVVLGTVLVRTRFDYWEVKNNELLHHHGILGDVERWPAPGMRISKEIKDVMEYALCGSGRLVLRPGGESRAIVIDNVPMIGRVEKRMQELLNTLQVHHVDE